MDETMLNELYNNRYRIDFPVKWVNGNNTITVTSYQTDKVYDFVLEKEGMENITLKNFVYLLRDTDIKFENNHYEEI